MFIFFIVILLNGIQEITILANVFEESFLRIKVSNLVGDSEFSNQIKIQKNIIVNSQTGMKCLLLSKPQCPIKGPWAYTVTQKINIFQNCL